MTQANVEPAAPAAEAAPKDPSRSKRKQDAVANATTSAEPTLAEHVARRAAEIEENEAREASQNVVNTGTLGETPRNPDGDDKGSMSELIFEDEDAYKLVKTFADIFATFPIGVDGHIVEVERTDPATHDGVATKGILPPITKPISFPQFVNQYGGRKYELSVYGPSPRTNKFVRRVKPIKVEVPGNIPPRLDADRSPLGQSTNSDARIFETQMQYVEKQREREERQDEKNEAREMAREDKARRDERTNADLAVSVLQTQLKQAQAAVERMQEKLEQERAAREEKEKETTKQPDMSAMMAAQIDAQARVTAAALTAASVKPQSDPAELKALQDLQLKLSEQHKDEIKTLTAQHAAEMKTLQDLQGKLTEQHRKEIDTLSAQHTAELTRLRDDQAKELTRLREDQTKEVRRLDELVTEERKRADERIKQNAEHNAERIKAVETQAAERLKTTETQAAERIKAVEERARADLVSAKEDVNQAKADGDRRVNDLKDRYDDRIKDLDRGHKRDIDGSRERWELQLSNEKTALQTQIVIKDQELSRLQAELAEVREEAKRPLTERINEVAAAAEALGYGKNEPEPKDWKQMALEVGGNLVANLPELLRSAGDTVGKLRQQPTPQQMAAYTQAQQAQMQAASGTHAAQLAAGTPARPRGNPYGRRGGFATEDGPAFEGPRMAPVPVFPGQSAPTAPAQTAAPAAAAIPPVTAAPPTVAPATAAQPAPVAIPASGNVESTPASNVGEGEPVNSVTDQQVLQFLPVFELALKQGASAEELGGYLLNTYGKNNVGIIVTMINPERVVSVLQANGAGASPLCRRDGQKYLRETFGILQKLCA